MGLLNRLAISKPGSKIQVEATNARNAADAGKHENFNASLSGEVLAKIATLPADRQAGACLSLGIDWNEFVAYRGY